MLIRFDIWFTGYKPERNFLVGSNISKKIFPKISRKVKFFVFSFLYHDCLHLYCLQVIHQKYSYIFDELLEEKKRVFIFSSHFILKMAISITALAGAFRPLFQPTFVFNSAFENDSSD
jgi:uncharacterized membrane protein